MEELAIECRSSLEQLLFTMVADMRRLEARVVCLEQEHGDQLRKLASGLDVLATNVQGFDAKPEVLDATQRARKRWHWAFDCIRAHGKVQLTQIKVGRANSLAVRLKEVEEKLDDANLQIHVLMAEAGPEHMRAAERRTDSLETGLQAHELKNDKRHRGLQKRLDTVQVDVEMTSELAKKLETRSEDQDAEIGTLRGDVEAASDAAASAAAVVARLNAKLEADDPDVAGALRRRVPVLAAVLADACTRPARDKKKLPKKLRDRLHSIYSHIVAADLETQDDDKWRCAVATTARFLHGVLEDGDHDLHLIEARVPPRPVLQKRLEHRDDVDFIAGLTIATVRDAADVCRAVCAHALAATKDAACDPGMLALQTWYLLGPASQKTRAHLDACDAGIVAAQARLDLTPQADVVDQLSHRITSLEDDATPEKDAIDVDAFLEATAAVRRAHDDLKSVKAVVDDTQVSLDALRDDLHGKAGREDTLDVIARIKTDLGRLASSALSKHQLHEGLSTKLDRKDLNRIAALIANGKLPGLNAAVAAKLQIPDFRCLCCDRPLPSQAMALSALARHVAREDNDDDYDQLPQRPVTALPFFTSLGKRTDGDQTAYSDGFVSSDPLRLDDPRRPKISSYPRIMPAPGADRPPSRSAVSPQGRPRTTPSLSLFDSTSRSVLHEH